MADTFGKYHVSDIPHLNLASVLAHSGISSSENITLVRISYSKCFGILKTFQSRN